MPEGSRASCTADAQESDQNFKEKSKKVALQILGDVRVASPAAPSDDSRVAHIQNLVLQDLADDL